MSTSYFSNSHDFHVSSITIRNQMPVASRAFEHLHNNIAADAMHNSDERCDAPKCYPETRQAVQEEILSWITDGDDDAEPKKILWLTGPAGAGKTAIAGSIAEICDERGILAGTFFFSSFAGSESRRTKRCLITTLAYCLLQHDGLQQLRGPILSAIERDPSIFCKNLSAQCKALILKPLHDVVQQLVQSVLPKVIVIDGLDEVEASRPRHSDAHEPRLANETEQVEILSTLLQAAHNSNFPFRILIVSRPEPAIRDFFSSSADSMTREIFLNNKYNPDRDIALFFQAKFSELRRRYKLPMLWPEQKVLEQLRDRASGQFIYAATVVRFLQTSGMHPQARLDCILHANSAQPASGATVFSSLDALYTQILRSSPDPVSSTHWIGAIHSLSNESAFFIRQFLQDYHGQADYLLENLASLIFTPAIEDALSPFVIYHKSLVDFLRDPERCGSEINEAFDSGCSNLLNKHYVQVLSAKSPTLPLTDPEWQDFLQPFMRNLLVSFSPMTVSPWEGALATCDIQWWVRAAVVIFSRDTMEARRFVGRLFQMMHNRCWTDSDCRPLCKSWRSKVLGGCKALGWLVPNAIAFLRNRMWHEVFFKRAEELGTAPKIDLTLLFKPPRRDPQGIADSVWVREGPAPHTPDEDYGSMCHLAELLYSRLPEPWRELYIKELREGGSPYNVLRVEIGKILHDLGIEIEDVDPDAS